MVKGNEHSFSFFLGPQDFLGLVVSHTMIDGTSSCLKIKSVQPRTLAFDTILLEDLIVAVNGISLAPLTKTETQTLFQSEIQASRLRSEPIISLTVFRIGASRIASNRLRRRLTLDQFRDNETKQQQTSLSLSPLLLGVETRKLSLPQPVPLHGSLVSPQRKLPLSPLTSRSSRFVSLDSRGRRSSLPDLEPLPPAAVVSKKAGSEPNRPYSSSSVSKKQPRKSLGTPTSNDSMSLLNNLCSSNPNLHSASLLLNDTHRCVSSSIENLSSRRRSSMPVDSLFSPELASSDRGGLACLSRRNSLSPSILLLA